MMRWRTAATWAWLTCGAALTSCTSPRTEIVLAIESDLPWGVGGDITSIVVDVRRGGPEGAERHHLQVPLGTTAGRASLPYLVGLLPKGGDTSGSVWIQALACRRDGVECTVADALVVQQAVVTWIPERTQLIRLRLSRACVSPRTCPAGQSCDPDLGRCAELAVVGRRSFLPDDQTQVRYDAATTDLAPLDATGSDAESPRDVADSSAPVDASSDVPDVPVTPDVPDVPVTPDLPDVPVTPDLPDVPITPDVTSPMDAPDVTSPVDAPDVISPMDAPDVTSPMDAPDVTVAPDVPASLTQRSCPMPAERGCGMAAIDRGTLTLGGGTRETMGVPVQPSVTVDRFAIDRYEVTWARFARFWSARGDAGAGTPATLTYRRGAGTYELPIAGAISTVPELTFATSCSMNEPARWADHPMNCLNWYTAQAFCAWDGGRLPTEAEFELAARGTAGRAYAWGAAEPTAERGCWGEVDAGERGETCAVGSFPLGATPEGVHDLAGSMIEFTADLFEDYRDDATGCWGGAAQTNPLCLGGASQRAVRSSSWRTSYAPYTNAWTRDHRGPTDYHYELGFRCARSL